MKTLIVALIALCSIPCWAQAPAEQGIAELQLNGGCWPLGVNGRWPPGVSERQMYALAENGNANAQYLTALPLIAVHTEIVVPGSPIGVGVNASTLGRPSQTRTVYNNVANAIEGFRLLNKAAEQGHIQAQMRLGQIYESENRVQDAVKWYVKAAGQGSETAMQTLGTIYRDGYIFIESYKWYALASAKCLQRGGDLTFFVNQRNYLIQNMDANQLEEAQNLIEEWNRSQTK